jgi:hypothetical protein
MKESNVSRIVSLVPERISRLPSGSAFIVNGAGGSSDPARLAHVARFLQWLSPLNPLDKEDQRALGLLSSNGRPLQPGEEPAEEPAAGLADDFDPEETLPN